MPPVQQYVPNVPLQVAKNLRFIDPNGYPVDKQFPNDYTVNIGGTVSNNIDTINIILDTLGEQETLIANNATAINNILASGATAIPDVYAYCFLSSGAGLYPMNVVVDDLTKSVCNYYSSVGTASQMSLAGSQQCANLNTGARFAVPNAQMQSITGWKSTIQTVADSLNNLWLTTCDLRGGMELVMAQIKPSCSQVIVDYQAVPTIVAGTTPTMLLYFAGYTFVPEGYTDTGSSVIIVDGAGNEVTSSFDIIALAQSETPLSVVLTPGVMLPTTNYTVYVNSSVENTTWGNSCYKGVVKTVSNTTTGCPVITAIPGSASINYTLNLNITTNATYSIQLLTSGAVIATQTLINSNSNIYNNTFNALTSGTVYQIVVSVKIGELAPVYCTPYPVSTTP